MNFNDNQRDKYDTYAEISLSALKKNFTALKKIANNKSDNKVKICSIVKANAYGHGMNEIAHALTEYGTEYLGTADYNESIRLADYLKENDKENIPILCLGIMTEGKLFEEIISRNIDVSVTDLKIAACLDNFARGKNKTVNIQIQVDSGINRIGFSIKDAYEAVSSLRNFKNLCLKGIYSHFATSEIPDNEYAKKQLREFKQLVNELEGSVHKFELKHISNTGGIMNYNDPYFNMVRPGISLYGYFPDEKYANVNNDAGLEPVMTLKTRVKFIKVLEKGQSISYGRKFISQSKTTIASIPAGYGDGYSNALTNKSHVVINGKKFRTAGAICMDWTMVDLGLESGVKIDDEVIVFGKEYPAYELAKIIGTIPYEIVCLVTPRVPRIYI